MTEFSLADYLDIEAVVDNEEEEEDLQEEELDFLHDDTEESEADWTRPRSVTPVNYNEEAEELRALADATRAPRAPRLDSHKGVSQHLLVPAQGDPDVWAVRVKHGFESSLVLQIGSRAVTGDLSHQPGIASVFARPGIPGCIFLEGRLNDVTAALKGLVTVYKAPPRFVPPSERGTILSPRNPLSSIHSICGGNWVRCLHGLYRGDVGLVCEVDSTSEASVVVAFLPRIPDRTVVPAKRKRGAARPNPRLWFPSQVEAVWGKSRVRRFPEDKYTYEFDHETYRTGLIIKPLPPVSIVVASAPPNVGPFIERYAQDSINIGQRVQVISEELSGLVGHAIDIIDGVAAVQLNDDNMPLLQVPLGSLLPAYELGDHVKHAWSDTCGIVMSIESGAVSFIDSRTQNGFTTHMYFVTPYTPPHNFYQFKTGTWVEFRGPKDTERPKRRGWVHSVEDTQALVIEERTFTEFEIDTRELEVSAAQSRSLPAKDLDHPMLGKRVVVTSGPRKGYDGYIRAVGNTTVTVELNALFSSTAWPIQPFAWKHIRPMSAAEESARTRPDPRPRTPSPAPASDLPRASTPEPEGNHWVFTTSIQGCMERARIVFLIRNIRGSADKSLDKLEGETARTLPERRRELVPEAGEIVVEVILRNRKKQFSLHPKYLNPWKPVVGGGAVVVQGKYQGVLGVVKEEKDDGLLVVTFTVDDDSRDFVLGQSDLAATAHLD